MKNLIKYGCYTLLAVAVFTAFWLIGWFISLDYNVFNWKQFGRLLLFVFTFIVVVPTIITKERG